MLKRWFLAQLEAVKDEPTVIVRDPLGLTQGMANDLNAWGKAHEFTVIPFATNLLFRWKYEQARKEEANKLLCWDQTPLKRRQARSMQVASAPFYPDLLARIPSQACIELDLRQFLRETSGDPDWPAEANDPLYARLIVRHLDGVLRAHRNLRTAGSGRFTDYDFKVIVAYAALGIPGAAFKKPSSEDYWRIGLLAHDALAELEELAPEVTRPIKEELSRAPAPFRWFTDHDPEAVTRAFYLSAILVQHTEQWRLLLANIDPALASMASMDPGVLAEAAPKLVALDPTQADRDLAAVEAGLDARALQFLLVDHLRLEQPAGFSGVVERERYSVLLRSLALLLALDDVLAPIVGAPLAGSLGIRPEHIRINNAIFGPATPSGSATLSGGVSTDSTAAAPWSSGFIERRPSPCWTALCEAYRLATEVRTLQAELAGVVKALKVRPDGGLTFDFFRGAWNDKRLNRLEVSLSALERLADSGVLLPRREDELPSAFANAVARLRVRIGEIGGEVRRGLEEVNRRFQLLIARQYPGWIKGDERGGIVADSESRLSEPCLTAHFLRRCLRPHWDPSTEHAVLLIFDGMRYDIWEELLRPMLADSMELIADYPGLSLLPSETHITRKAICAGAPADQFDSRAAEDALLRAGLARELGYETTVEVLAPEGLGTGETVRYRAGNLDVYIFELCDKELHKVQMRTLPDGREVPTRPLAFIYQQHIKSVLETEVMAILRRLTPGTKVFITADHGFGPVARQPLWFDDDDLNEPDDCSYLNCRLSVPIEQARIPARVRDNIIAFTPEQLRMPIQETRAVGGGAPVTKQYRAIVFPATGFSFKRQGAPYRPDAYTHGGISLQELIIPMVVLRVKSREDGLLSLGPIVGPDEVIEGEEATFTMAVRRGGAAPGDTGGELRIEVEASYAADRTRFPLPGQVIYLPAQGVEVAYRFRPDPEDATTDERRAGLMRRTLIITAATRGGRHATRKSQSVEFEVRLNTDRVIRRVGNLGSILGLVPKKLGG